MSVDIDLMCMHFRWFMEDVHTVEDFQELCDVSRRLHEQR